ncbi:MAG: leucyl aminopeptidase family protein [Nocardioidaceae bacterium]|nr:leucyl aminopeptidase family protein [Nocardioidaceae bacterium]
MALSGRPVADHVRASSGQADVPVLALGFTRSADTYALSDGADSVTAELGIDLGGVLARAQAVGSGGEAVALEILTHRRVRQLLLVGLGQQSPRDYRRAGATIARAAQRRGKAVVSLDASTGHAAVGAFVEGAVLGPFGFERKSAPSERAAAELCLTGWDRKIFGRIVDEATAIGVASRRARYFAITPSSEKSPERLESWSRELTPAGLTLEVWDDARLVAEGFGGIVAVGSASAYASRFLRLDYTPRRSGRRGGAGSLPHVVLVGKGITFDTGGISIKSADAMMNMKRDMTGAAVVMGVMGALRELGVRVRVTGLIAAAENAFGAAAMRPGDVVTHYGGRTSEVGNTDAEGRLVLADALAYADQHIDATTVVDIATLTGAGKVALGTSMGALFSNDDSLAGALEAAGLLAGEPVWRLPLAEVYEDLLKSPSADATNAAGGPGAITAALFLQHFAGSKPWAHLDIASVGDSPDDAFEYTKGATGFGARLLLRWLQNL